jgi:hypothetical protein
MESKRIPLKGIVRNSSSQLSEDGEMIDVINLRNKYGKLQPIKDAEKVYQSQYPIVYIHKNLDYENWISYDSNTGNLYWEAKKENDILVPVNKQITKIYNILGISQVGNIINFVSQENIYNILFDGEYRTIPPFETLEYDIKINKIDIEYKQIIYDNVRELPDINVASGDIAKITNEIKESGKFYNSLLVRYAFRLYDGSYVLTSNPIVFNMTDGIKYEISLPAYDPQTVIYIQEYKIGISANIKNINDFKDIITSLDFFVCEIPTYDSYDQYVIDETNKTIFGYNGLYEKFGTAHNFYLIESIDIKDLLKIPTDLSKSIPTNKDYVINLTSQKELENEQTRGGISANHIFNYNSKIHISGIKNILFKGYSPRDFENGFFYYQNSSRLLEWDKAYIKIYLKNNLSEESIIIQEYENNNNYDFNFMFSPYLSYPDPNAYKIEIGVLGKYGIEEDWDYGAKIKTFELKKHPNLNIAYYLENNLKASFETNNYSLDCSLEEFNEEIGEEINPIIEEPSKIKVSSLNNPFVFPPEQTYTVGSGDILGMASVTAALSQGQFGQFPLYVFTTEGIWALQVGTGEVAYTTANPVSRDVCNNPDSITPIDNAVIFTTEKGVNIISGSSVKSLSDDLDGETINISNDSSVYFIQNLAEAIATIGLQSSFNDELFTDYIRTARLAYNYNEGEIYAINTSKNYYYCYSIANKEWSKRSGKFKGIIESYPNLYLQNDDNEIFKVNNENGNLKQWIFISRPVKLTGIQHKRIIRSFLRGLYNSTNSSKIAFSIFGSFDGESFELVNSVQGIAKNQRDILLGRSIRPYTYFIFAAYASSGTESEISAIDVMFEQVKRTLAI